MVSGPDGVYAAARAHIGQIERIRKAAVKRRAVGDAARALELEYRPVVEFSSAIVDQAIVTSRKWRQIRAAVVRGLGAYPAAANAVSTELELPGA